MSLSLALMPEQRSLWPTVPTGNASSRIADWKRFKEFWKRVEQFAEEMDAKAQADMKSQYEQARKLDSCLAILAERKE